MIEAKYGEAYRVFVHRHDIQSYSNRLELENIATFFIGEVSQKPIVQDSQALDVMNNAPSDQHSRIFDVQWNELFKFGSASDSV